MRTKGIPLPTIVLKARFSVKARLLKGFRGCRDAKVRLRYLVVLNVLNKRSAAEVEAVW
ncbi:MAG: hypothetical protein L0Z62_48785 [Gemmataceae bacterium]|nr:hypothetical protein [Gemmataceae bacterium]